MDPFLILAVGMVIVVASILLLRLHAFLALVAAALVVGALTPPEAILGYLRDRGAGVVENVDETTGQVEFTKAKGQTVEEGMLLLVYVQESEQPSAQPIARLRAIALGEDDPRRKNNRAVAVIERGPVKQGDRVLDQASWSSTVGKSRQMAATRVAEAFGATCVKIGILIAMASIIGKCLLESGAADRIIRSALSLFGEKRAAQSFLFSGFLLGIPVFFDTVFYLMIPLGKALRMRTGRDYLLYILTITAGASMAHSLVPPTPGPLIVVEILGVSVGAMMLGGCYVGLFTAVFGYYYASWANRKWEIPLRGSAEFSLEELEKISNRDESQLPPLWLSLLPILLPVLLIGGNTILDPKIIGFDPNETLKNTMEILGDKNIALIVSAAIALAMLVRQKRKENKPGRQAMADGVAAALASGGVIILITAAGGSFGAMLQQTGIGIRIGELADKYQIAVLPLAFFVTALVRTAQGSATVAMITAAGILASFATSPDLGFHPVYLAMAIGCGSKPIAWMNDSGFWVICKMSGMTEAETLKTLTPMTTCMGLVGLAVTMVTSWLLPLTG